MYIIFAGSPKRTAKMIADCWIMLVAHCPHKMTTKKLMHYDILHMLKEFIFIWVNTEELVMCLELLKVHEHFIKQCISWVVPLIRPTLTNCHFWVTLCFSECILLKLCILMKSNRKSIRSMHDLDLFVLPWSTCRPWFLWQTWFLCRPTSGRGPTCLHPESPWTERQKSRTFITSEVKS